MKDLLTIEELPARQIREYLDTALCFKKSLLKGSTPRFLEGQSIVHLFFENSTRTRTSFEFAVRKLGGTVVNFATSSSSLQKGESLLDTVQNIVAMGPHCLVVRHTSSGSPAFLAKQVKVPVVNAGDGFHEHPTQALLDAFTIEEKLGTIKGKKVLIMGDIAHSRVARSNIYLLNKMGAKVSVCAPPTLLPPHVEQLGVNYCYRPEEELADVDVVMALRVQLERQNRYQLPSISEYSKFWGLNSERAALMKSSAIILHPGPINRGVELDPEVADSPRSVILDQVNNGIIVRMAVLAHHCNPKGLQKWLKQK